MTLLQLTGTAPGGSAAPLRKFLCRAACARLMAGHGPCRGSALRRFRSDIGGGFRRCLAFKARIASINSYAAGTQVGYGPTHTLDRDSRLASVTVGYGDGYRRALAAVAMCLSTAIALPLSIVVSMNSMVVDVTDVAEVSQVTKSCCSAGKDTRNHSRRTGSNQFSNPRGPLHRVGAGKSLPGQR